MTEPASELVDTLRQTAIRRSRERALASRAVRLLKAVAIIVAGVVAAAIVAVVVVFVLLVAVQMNLLSDWPRRPDGTFVLLRTIKVLRLLLWV